MCNDNPVCLSDTVIVQFFIKRDDRPQDHHFNRLSLLFQLMCDFQSVIHTHTPGHDRCICSLASYTSMAEREDVVCIRFQTSRLHTAIEALVFEEDDRIF